MARHQRSWKLIAWCRSILREIVLGRVAALVKKFVRAVSLNRGLSEAAANAAGGKISPLAHIGWGAWAWNRY